MSAGVSRTPGCGPVACAPPHPWPPYPPRPDMTRHFAPHLRPSVQDGLDYPPAFQKPLNRPGILPGLGKTISIISQCSGRQSESRQSFCLLLLSSKSLLLRMTFKNDHHWKSIYVIVFIYATFDCILKMTTGIKHIYVNFIVD